MAQLNTFDVPEMMPGALNGANPAERWGFEQRCKQLHEEAVEEETQEAQHSRAASGGAATADDLVSMFPSLDAALVRTLVAEARTPQHAIETLLALAAATGEPGDDPNRPRATTPPPRDLGTKDMNLFPSLTDASGWQMPSRRGFELDAEADDKTGWRDRAKGAADKPGPAWGPRKPVVAPRKKKTSERDIDAEENIERVGGLTEYELRQQQGQRRSRNLAQYGGRGRGGRSGRGRGSITPGEAKNGSDHESSEEGRTEDADALPTDAV